MDAARIITVARERAGLSKRELARRAGTSPAAIVKYESGATSPTVDTLNRILEVAGWRIEPALTMVSADLIARGEMMADLLSIVDMVPLATPSSTIEFPRFADVVH
jgi:hypothetical protein